MHVVVDPTLDSFLITMERSFHGFPIDHEEEGRNEYYNEDGR